VVKLATLALALLTSCGFDDSLTCGRGRCRGGSTCISIFGDGRINQGWNDTNYPNVENEWWCFRPCPSGFGCADNTCLQNPTDENDIVCTAHEVGMVMYSQGTSCLCTTTGPRMCELGQPVQALQITDTCAPKYNVLQSCVPGMDCVAGTFHSGDTVPGARLSSADGKELLYCPGFPGNTFAQWLPQGKRIKMYVDNNACP
jgi:hypothetical protein